VHSAIIADPENNNAELSHALTRFQLNQTSSPTESGKTFGCRLCHGHLFHNGNPEVLGVSIPMNRSMTIPQYGQYDRVLTMAHVYNMSEVVMESPRSR